MPETCETIDVLLRRLNEDRSESLADLVARQDACLRAALSIATRARAAGRSDARIMKQLNFVTATAEAMRLTERIERHTAQHEAFTERIAYKEFELQCIASVPLAPPVSGRVLARLRGLTPPTF